MGDPTLANNYIGENSERCEVRKRERDQHLKRKLYEWDKEQRFKKIVIIREWERRRRDGESRENRESKEED